MLIREKYFDVERRSHVNDLLAIALKADEEVWEIIAWKKKNDKTNLIEETRDAIVNIISVATKLWIAIDEEKLQREMNITEEQLLRANNQWKKDILWITKKYSRKIVTPEKMQLSTQWLLSSILSYSNSQESIDDAFVYNIPKFESRIDEYKPKVDLKSIITNHPDFPQLGIQFKDISPLLRDKKVMEYITNDLLHKTYNADVIVWLDARWFLFGILLAHYLEKPFVMVRKSGKLPWEVEIVEYDKEYKPEDIVWSDGIVVKPKRNAIEIQRSAINLWDKVAIVDDLLATWGTVNAAASLVEKVGWKVMWVFTIIQLDNPALVDMRKSYGLDKYNVTSLVTYDD